MTMYSIDGLCPSGGMGGYGFSIHLSTEWRDAVAASGIDQVGCDRLIQTWGPEWLVKCGFSHYFDPENCGFDAERYRPPSEECRLSSRLSVSWGEWGPEHITVPGNACGLDVDRGVGCVFDDGRVLLPHNVDHWGQVNLLLIVFSWFGHSLALERACSR